jgi:hypothetical protein
MTTSERAAAAGDVVARAHAKLLADASLQFQFTRHVVPPPPSWLTALAKMLQALGPAVRILVWAVVAAVVLGAVFLIVRAVVRYRRRFKPYRVGGPSLGADPASLQPTGARALALLEEADRLAAQQRFEEAAHVLLFRTIADVESRRPRAVRPALTSRDIAGLDQIPSRARDALAIIVERVEHGFFGGRPVGAAEFAACRGAYMTFADPQSWAAGAPA